MPQYTVYKAVQHIGRALLTEQLKSNLISFIDWANLEIGGFFNVRIPSTGAYGGLEHRLRLADDPHYTKGKVWEGFRSNWVWESGLEYAYQPIKITGVYVDGAYKPVGTTGAFSYHINYPLGRVIFNSAINTTSVVTCEYSYKYYNVTKADSPWFRNVMFNSFRVDDSHFHQYGSGQWSIPASLRMQLPAVVVDVVPRRKHIPHEIGGGTLTYQDVNVYVLAETDYDRDQMLDVIDHQFEKTICGYDKNSVLDADKFPLDANGNIRPSALMYPNLVNPDGAYAWKKIEFKNTQLLELESNLPLFQGVVRATLEVHTPEI